MIDWQVTEILAGCLFTALFFAVALISIQCLSTCYENWKFARQKTDAERLPDDYVDEIRRLLNRHKRVMHEYDFPTEHIENESLKADSTRPITESEIGSPIRVRSHSDSVKLQKLKEELDEYIVDPGSTAKAKYDCDAKRRSWGGLNESVFDPVELPDSHDASVQTTATLDRMRLAKKIETTV